MRVSVVQGDPGYVPEHDYYEVWLDGVKLNNCRTADEELGEAHVYLTKEGAEAAGIISTVEPATILYGKVEVKRV